MRKLSTLITASVAALAISSSSAQAATKMNMATSWGGGPMIESVAQKFADSVATLSGGEIEIVVYPGGTLGSPLEVSETVKTGLAEAGHSSANYDWGKNPANIFFGGWAGGLSPDQMLSWLYQGGGLQLYKEFRLETAGVIEMPCGMTPREAGMHSRKSVKTLEDIKGLKIRTAGVWSAIISDLGATTVSLPASEIFSALERGVVDAIEWNSFSLNRAEGFHNLAEYLIVPGVHQPVVVTSCLFNPEAWSKLSERDKAIIEVAAKEVTFDFYEKLQFEDIDAYKFFQSSGVKIVELDDEVKAAVKTSIDKWATATLEKEGDDSWFARLYHDQENFRKNWLLLSGYR